MSDAAQLLTGVTAVCVEGQALLIQGPPGSGKSALALALIDRGAHLIGDDGVRVTREGDRLLASPPPRISGLLEVRGVGLVRLPCMSGTLALVLRLDLPPPRLPDTVGKCDLLGLSLPMLGFRGGDAVQAVRAEWALRVHGIARADGGHSPTAGGGE